MTATRPFRLSFADLDLEAAIRDELEAVEQLLRTSVKSEYPFVSETAGHLVIAGGKRFRPLLTLLAAHLGRPDAPGVLSAAVVVELTHLATLYHDDVMDEASMRRGAPSANTRWSNTIAILTGDFLFARASELLADLGPECVRIQAQTFEQLVQGQIRETVGPEPGDDPLAHYLGVVADKTGSLIATSARFGAMLGGLDDAVIDLVTRFGERIGVAFQLSDDVLDVVSDSRDSGKVPGTDLREGIPTLPGLLALRALRAEDGRLAELLSAPVRNDDEVTEALALLRQHPALEEASAVVRSWADAARADLHGLPDSPVRRALEAMCDLVVDRTN
jgi:heptaprenyl diphosphate synthase